MSLLSLKRLSFLTSSLDACTMIAAFSFLICLFLLAPIAEAQQQSVVNPSLDQSVIIGYKIVMASSPIVCLTGTIPTGGMSLNVQISGETATTEQDRVLTVPFESASAVDNATVFVPAGEYDGASAGSLFVVPFSLFSDGVNGSAEKVNFIISGAPPGATVANTSTCNNNTLANSGYAINGTPTSAIVTVGGRVMSWTGSGVARANISISNATGQTRTVQTNLFGYYRFQNISAGETYVFNVQSKRYGFTPTLVAISTNLTDLNFTAQAQ